MGGGEIVVQALYLGAEVLGRVPLLAEVAFILASLVAADNEAALLAGQPGRLSSVVFDGLDLSFKICDLALSLVHVVGQ